jgi:hypothetical protein
MTTTSIRPTTSGLARCERDRLGDDLDTREAGSGVVKGIAVGGPLGSLIGMGLLTMMIPALGPGAVLAGIIIGLVADIVLGA